ncbi:MAG: hypothetical protein SWY16_06125 [Cyanobacteriota bacterium]|nr:hypothetical protein [Cyanobacteriota bacterium]
MKSKHGKILAMFFISTVFFTYSPRTALAASHDRSTVNLDTQNVLTRLAGEWIVPNVDTSADSCSSQSCDPDLVCCPQT